MIKNMKKISDQSIDIYFSHDVEFANRVLKSLQSLRKKLEQFYWFSLSHKVKLSLVESNEELIAELKKHTDSPAPWFLTGFKGNRSEIYYLTPNAIQRKNPNIKNPTEYVLLGAAHELAHVYNQQLNIAIPRWLDDGLASALSGQRPSIDYENFMGRARKITKNISQVPTLAELKRDFVKKDSYNGYDLSWLIVAYLLKIGKNVHDMEKIVDTDYSHLVHKALEYFNDY
jgi:hypothetical protein